MTRASERSIQATFQPRCGRCGRFARPVRLGGDQFGNTWEIVDCSQHGETREA